MMGKVIVDLNRYSTSSDEAELEPLPLLTTWIHRPSELVVLSCTYWPQRALSPFKRRVGVRSLHGIQGPY